MQRFPVLLTVLLITAINSYAQKNYFQQEVNYTIRVQLNDTAHSLSAFESISYKNNSPDTLKELWFHLWPNAYRNNNSALIKQQVENGNTSLYFASKQERGFIDSLDFRTNDKSLQWQFDKYNADICKIKLASPLLPGESVVITTPFYVKIPDAKFSRLGHTGQFYAITQWYPKPAVYDNKGWHAIPYLDQGEFYSEFGSFDVTITLPKNYVVGATGELVDGENEIAWLTEKSKLEVPITEDKDMSFPSSSSELKTLRYKQDKVHDFAFFADKRYHVRKGEVSLPSSGRKVTTWAFFTNSEARLWLDAVKYINNTLLSYSEWIGEYPYSACTAIDGTISAGGGMEYPMITIIGKSHEANTLETFIAHEVGHNWFYGILGSNERNHPWMDEGINSYYEARSFLKEHPSKESGNYNDLTATGVGAKLLEADKIDAMKCSRLGYLLSSSSNSDQAISLSGEKFTSINYGLIVYMKAPAALNYLENYLGKDLFDSCMHAYFDEWKFRHPYPDDMKQVFEKTSRKKLDWFFKDLLTTTNKQDLKISSFKSGDKSLASIKSKNGVLWPFPVSTLTNDSVINTTWIEPTQTKQEYTIPCNGCDEVVIDKNEVTLDVNLLNNNSSSSGIWKKADTVKLKFLAGIPYKPQQTIFFSPVAGWNNYNKFMVGVLIHNRFLPFKRFEYSLAPMYGFNDKEIAGVASADYHFLPKSELFRDITLHAGVRRFAFEEPDYRDLDLEMKSTVLHYTRFNPAVIFNFKSNNPRSREVHAIELSSVHILQDDIKYTQLNTGESYGVKEEENLNFYRIRYQVRNDKAIDPWSLVLRYEGAEGLTKTDLTFNYRISYKKKGRGTDIRLFAGHSWNNSIDALFNYTLSDRSTAGGTTDYAYDDYYFGRTEIDGFLSKQIALRDGAFKSINALGTGVESLVSLNIEADFPGRIPFRFFVDIATYNDINKTLQQVYDFEQLFTADAGICLSLAKGGIAIYVPLLRSREIKEYEKTNELDLGDQIRFVFDINKLNPLNLRKQLIQ